MRHRKGPASPAKIPAATRQRLANIRRNSGLDRDQQDSTFRPPLRRATAAGRSGDTVIAHLTPGERIIPANVLPPELEAELDAALAAAGLDPGRYRVGGSDDSRNPVTGAPEFYLEGGEGEADPDYSFLGDDGTNLGGTSDPDDFSGGGNTAPKFAPITNAPHAGGKFGFGYGYNDRGDLISLTNFIGEPNDGRSGADAQSALRGGNAGGGAGRQGSLTGGAFGSSGNDKFGTPLGASQPAAAPQASSNPFAGGLFGGEFYNPAETPLGVDPFDVFQGQPPEVARGGAAPGQGAIGSAGLGRPDTPPVASSQGVARTGAYGLFGGEAYTLPGVPFGGQITPQAGGPGGFPGGAPGGQQGPRQGAVITYQPNPEVDARIAAKVAELGPADAYLSIRNISDKVVAIAAAGNGIDVETMKENIGNAVTNGLKMTGINVPGGTQSAGTVIGPAEDSAFLVSGIGNDDLSTPAADPAAQAAFEAMRDSMFAPGILGDTVIGVGADDLFLGSGIGNDDLSAPAIAAPEAMNSLMFATPGFSLADLHQPATPEEEAEVRIAAFLEGTRTRGGVTPAENSMLNAGVAPISGTTFFGGAGMRSPYVSEVVQALRQVGLQNVRAADPDIWSRGMVRDVISVLSERNRDDEKSNFSKFSSGGGQFNLVGYSYGGLQAAQAAIDYAEKGGVVDNVVLLATPISQEFLDELQNNSNIKSVEVLDLTEKGDPIKAGDSLLNLLSDVPKIGLDLISRSLTDRANGHLHITQMDKEGDARRQDLAKQLFELGLR